MSVFVSRWLLYEVSSRHEEHHPTNEARDPSHSVPPHSVCLPSIGTYPLATCHLDNLFPPMVFFEYRQIHIKSINRPIFSALPTRCRREIRPRYVQVSTKAFCTVPTRCPPRQVPRLWWDPTEYDPPHLPTIYGLLKYSKLHLYIGMSTDAQPASLITLSR